MNGFTNLYCRTNLALAPSNFNGVGGFSLASFGGRGGHDHRCFVDSFFKFCGACIGTLGKTAERSGLPWAMPLAWRSCQRTIMVSGNGPSAPECDHRGEPGVHSSALVRLTSSLCHNSDAVSCVAPQSLECRPSAREIIDDTESGSCSPAAILDPQNETVPVCAKPSRSNSSDPSRIHPPSVARSDRSAAVSR